MSKITPIKTRLTRPIFGVIFAILSSFGLNLALTSSTPVAATPEIVTETAETTISTPETLRNLIADVDTTSDETSDAEVGGTEENAASESEATDTCYDQLGAIGWLVCPTTGVLGKAIDSIYGLIQNLLIVEPMTFDSTSPVYNVWQIMRDITNIVFVIMLLIVIYSQITINNYGIKKVLPKLIVSAVLINLSYLLCAIFVDVSNIVGSSIGGLFDSIQAQAITAGGLGDASGVTWTTLTAALIGGGTVLGLGVATVAAGLGGFLWPLLGTLIGGILSVLVGLVTLGLRQALIAMLVMIAPLAFVAYLLPNTESWFKKWKDTFASMLIFYPMFSLLFGASKLAGWALIANAVKSGSTFGIILGMAVQVFPLLASVSLMKMSGTILGKISSKLDGLADKPRTLAKDWAGSHGELAKLRHINHSNAPSAGMRRFLDRRRALREENIKNETTTRTGRGLIYAQRSILGTQKYDPADGTNQKNLKTTKSTRGAKIMKNTELELASATKDTAHVLDNYGDYHKATKYDKHLGDTAAHNYLELYRAALTEENDAFADEDFVMGQYNKFRNVYKTDENGALVYDENGMLVPKTSKAAHDYKHYITGAAGALGEKGELTVLGEVISKSAANEAKRRAYTNYVFSKYGYTKPDARPMLVGYYTDDDGFALNRKTGEKAYYYKKDTSGNFVLDKNGNKIKVTEKSPGEFLLYHPEVLAEQSAYEKKDENGFYYDAVDQEGNFVTRIYKKDTPAMKEIFANWDMPIADPIDGLYGILSGIYEGDIKGLEGVGLANLSTTLNRATMSSGFKEKAAYAGPMYATSVGNRYIKDFVHLNLARLDNLNKTGKPSNFNTQDFAEFQQLKLLMDPNNWDKMLFNEASLRSYKNVNGEKMKGTKFLLDELGNLIPDGKGGFKFEDVAPEDATFEQLKNTVIRKFVNGALPKFANMMSRMTPNIIDNQKPSAQASWNDLWGEVIGLSDNEEIRKIFPDLPKNADLADIRKKYPMLIDPLSNNGDTLTNATRLRSILKASPELRTRMQRAEDSANNVDREFARSEKNAPWSFYSQQDSEFMNHYKNIDILAAECTGDTNAFFDRAREYIVGALATDRRFEPVLDEFNEYAMFNGNDHTLTVEDHASHLQDLISTYVSD